MDIHTRPLVPFIISIVLVLLAYAAYNGASDGIPDDTSDGPLVGTYEECVAAGYPIAESFPQQCITPRGNFINPDDLEQRNQKRGAAGATARDGCVITGCSSQVCAEEEMATTCEFRPEYACFRETNAVCGKQANGKCGWDQTSELLACYQKALDQGGTPSGQPVELRVQ